MDTVSLKKLKNRKFIFIYLSKKSCSVCTAMKPKIIDLSDKYKYSDFIAIDLDEIQNAAGEFLVFSIPALLIYSEGKELYRGARFFNMKDIEKKMDYYYSLIFNESKNN